MAPYFAPGFEQQIEILARLERPHKEEVGRHGRRRHGLHRTEPMGGGFRHRHHALRAQAEALDGRPPHLLARSDHHGRQAEFEQHGRTPADALGSAMPAPIHPRREIVQGEHAGPPREIRHGEIGTVHQVRAQPPHLARQPPKPPAALHGVAWAAAALQVDRRGGRHAERLVGDQVEFVLGEAASQRQAEFGGVARQPAAGERERSGLNRHAHRFERYGRAFRGDRSLKR